MLANQQGTEQHPFPTKSESFHRSCGQEGRNFVGVFWVVAPSWKESILERSGKLRACLGRKFKLHSAAERLPLFYRALPIFQSQDRPHPGRLG